MGQVETGVRRRGLRRENQPSSIRREAVPRVHDRLIAPQRTCYASRRRSSDLLAVWAHQQASLVLDEDDPLSVGRDFWKVVAHAVLRSSHDALRTASFAIVERDAIEVVLYLGFVGRVGKLGGLLPWRVRIPRSEEYLGFVGRVGKLGGLLPWRVRIP